MIHLGAHMSIAGGYCQMGLDAVSIGADTLQFFARNPRGAGAKKINPEDMGAFRTLLEENKFAPILAHAPYTMNPCSKDPRIRELAMEMLAQDLQRMELLPGNYYNFHPGSHVGQGVKEGIRQITNMLNQVLFEGMHTTVLVETMAGKGTEVGRTFQELAEILDGVAWKDSMGVCMDLCHVWDGGYDISEHLEETLEAFDSVIGIERLKAVHVNDSKFELGSHKDRHAMIGEGKMGAEAVIRALSHPWLQGLPMILETPTDLSGHERELKMLRDWLGRESAEKDKER